MNTPNKDRIITLKKENNRSDWKCNLWLILYGRNGDLFLDNISNLSSTIVDDRVELLMESDIPGYGSKGVNKYSAPLKSVMDSLGATNVITGLAEITNSVVGNYNTTWNPWTKGVQAWDGADRGIQFDYTFNFAMGQYGLWNAKKEVVLPILNLIAPTLPRKISSYTMEGPYPTVAGLVAKVIRGINWEELGGKIESLGSNLASGVTTLTQNLVSNGFSKTTLDGMEKDATETMKSLQDIGNYLENIIDSSYSKQTYVIKFGKMQEFHKMLITDSSVSFSNQVDQYGYPIKGSVTLTFLGIIPPALSFDNNSNNVDKTSIKFGLDLSK